MNKEQNRMIIKNVIIMKRKTTGEGYKRKPKRGSMKTNENLWKS
jgi:hypothetical protein